MSEVFPPEAGTLPLARRVDEVCNRFEAAWRDGPRPQIEDFLGGWRDPERAALLRELIELEIFYRRGSGEDCRAEEYLGRFPDVDPAWLAQAFAAHDDSLSARPASPAEAGEAVPAVPGYAILGVLGRGGMGVVYQAHDPELNRSLAIKVLLPEHQGDPYLEQCFLEEAHLTVQLQHPGIPPIHEIGRLDDGRPFFAMKLVMGRTLAHLLKERVGPAERLPYFVGVFAQVCQTLAYAHSRGVLHRDLKPGNVMVGAFGEVQVMDWGLGRVDKGQVSLALWVIAAAP